MWQPRQMPELAAQLKARGLQMTPEDLSNLAAKPLDAVISLGGCTASFVSPKGLVITKHHCVSGVVAYHSQPEDRMRTRLNSRTSCESRMPSSDYHTNITTT